ncbi:MAG: hypothetical protein IKO88_05855 [Bacteroidales bacterium]|nr:hypothetical protein [Bacteroidales bacterium]
MEIQIMDFTISKYFELLDALKAYGFESLILRHDVDLKPANSLRTAQIEAEKGMHGIYYFRAVPESWDEEIIKLIALLGHEIGYHYESLTTCDGNVDKAYDDFCKNLEALRKLVPVRSICMHGSPRSPFDSKDIWKKYDYHLLGIESEPYLDTDFSKTLYLTDTGRRWDGYKVSVRDKIPQYQDEWTAKGLTFHTTDDVINALRNGVIPKHLMVTVHPQRWNPFGMAWCKELILQNTKNIVKRILIKTK